MSQIYLSDTNKKIGGVIGGIGETYHVDPTLLRLIVVLVSLLVAIFPMIVAYIIAWLIIPKRRVRNVPHVYTVGEDGVVTPSTVKPEWDVYSEYSEIVPPPSDFPR